MNLTDTVQLLGNIGEFLGSLGVLASLIYLAVQIKKNTETERTSTYQSIVKDFGDTVFAQAFVLVGAGFNSAALRGWIERYQNPAAGGWPTRSFASLEGACGWLARRPDQAADLSGPRRLFQAVAPSMGLGMPDA